MKFALINRKDLVIIGSSEDDTLDLTKASNEDTLILPLGELDLDTVKCVAFQDTETIVIREEQVFEPILDGEGNVISAGYTIPAVTEEREFTNYRLEVEPTLLAAKAEKVKYENYRSEAGALVKDIYAEMEKVYGSADDIGNIATYLTLLDMLANPDEYIIPEIGLIERKTIIGYADSELTKIRAYSKFRLLKLAQIKDKKEKLKETKGKVL